MTSSLTTIGKGGEGRKGERKIKVLRKIFLQVENKTQLKPLNVISSLESQTENE